METKLYTLRDACDILRLKPHVLAFVLSTKKVPEPLRLSGRRLFSLEDLTRISEYLKLSVNLHREGHAA